MACQITLRFPWLILLYNVERTACQLDVRIDLLTMQALHQLFVLHLQQDFDHPGDTRCPLQMSYVALQRTNPAPSLRHRSLGCGLH